LLLRAELGRTQLATEQCAYCFASLSYVFTHHERELSQRLAEIQHAHHDLSISSMHAHLDHDHSLETVILRGPTAAVQKLAETSIAERGVHHGKLNLIGVDVHGPHRHTKRKSKSSDPKVKAAEEAVHFHFKPSY
jgi:CopG family nickel-responsive transcriptional regulator